MEKLACKNAVHRSFVRASTGCSNPSGFIDQNISASRRDIGSSLDNDIFVTIGTDDLGAKLVARIIGEVQIPVVLQRVLLKVGTEGRSDTECYFSLLWLMGQAAMIKVKA